MLYEQEIPEWIDWKINLMYAEAEAEIEEPKFDLGTCQGCGAYGRVYTTHIRNGEECGEFI